MKNLNDLLVDLDMMSDFGPCSVTARNGAEAIRLLLNQVVILESTINKVLDHDTKLNINCSTPGSMDYEWVIG